MKLYLATNNAHKAGEIGAILNAADADLTVCPAKELGGMPPVVEDAPTFSGNALKKARALAAKCVGAQSADTWFVADDSGLCVDVLRGEPGVQSARFAGPRARDGDNTAKLLELLVEVPDGKRTAAFLCCLAVVAVDGREVLFEGRCPGRITDGPRGNGGFGYDPVFVPDGYGETFAELGEDAKNRISHRARALEKLAAWLKSSMR